MEYEPERRMNARCNHISEKPEDYPYNDTYMNMLSNTKIYGRVKNHFPVSLATANPRCYRRTCGQRTKVTL